MDPVTQQLDRLGQNRLHRATAIAAALVESLGDDADTLMLEALALLSDRAAVRQLPPGTRRELELAALAAWDRLSTPSRSICRRQHAPILRRILDAAAADANQTIRRRAIDLSRGLAAERDPTAWGVLERAIVDAVPGNARAAADAIAHAASRAGVAEPHAERAILAALRAYERHRCESVLLLAAEHADRAGNDLHAWLRGSAATLPDAPDLDATTPLEPSAPSAVDPSLPHEPPRAESPPDEPDSPAHLALRSAAKKLPPSVQDRLVAAWLALPCLAPVATRRLQSAGGEQAWRCLLARPEPDPSPAMASALRRLGPEPVVAAIAEMAAHPAAFAMALHACRTGAQRDAAAMALSAAREPTIRLAAVRHLARARPDARIERALSLRARDEEPAIAAAALAALARFTSVQRHLSLDSALAPFAQHPHPAIRAAAAAARRLTDPVAELIAAASIPENQPIPWRAPVAFRSAIASDPQPIARSLARIATDMSRPSPLRRAARHLLERLLPAPASRAAAAR